MIAMSKQTHWRVANMVEGESKRLAHNDGVNAVDSEFKGGDVRVLWILVMPGVNQIVSGADAK
jgi:hypothetical protein